MIKRIISGISATLLSFSSLFIFAPVMVNAAADTCTWTGGGADANFSTAGNWTCDTDVLESGDALVFDATTVDFDVKDPVNDLVDATFTSITWTQDTSNYDTATISGTAFSLSGDIVATGFGLEIDNDITLTGNVEIGNIAINGLVDIQSNDLTILRTTLTGGVSGDGSFILGDLSPTGGGGGCLGGLQTPRPVSGDSSGFSGSITIGANQFMLLTSRTNDITRQASSVTVNDDALLSLGLDHNSDLSFGGAITFNGGRLTSNQNQSDPDCNPPTTYKTATLSGTITATASVGVGMYGKTHITMTGTVTGAENFSVEDGVDANSKLTINGESSQSEKVTITVNTDRSEELESAYGNRELIIEKDGKLKAAYAGEGGIIKGVGYIGTLQVNQGGIFAPGMSPGCLTVENLVDQGEMQVELAGTTACSEYDQLTVVGSEDEFVEDDVVLFDAENDTENTSILNVSFIGDYLPVAGDTFTIIDNQGDTDVLGTFNGQAEGSTVTVGEVAFQISYVGGDGNDVVLTVISSPNTGSGTLNASPAMTIAAAVTAAGSIMLLGKRYAKFSR